MKSIRKITVMAICLALVLGSLSFSYADSFGGGKEMTEYLASQWGSHIEISTDYDDYWDGSVDKSWYDDDSDYFEIYTAAQLAGLADLVNGGKDFKGKRISLEADIYFAKDGKNTPRIGEYKWKSWPLKDEYDEFAGSFFGNGHTIYYDRGGSESDGSGLFGYTKKAEICDLAVSGICEGDNMTGGIVGWMQGGRIYNCVCDVFVRDATDNDEGGIVGKAENAVIESCTFMGTVKSGDVESNRGGIVGYFKNSEVRYCVNTGDIKASGYDAGGIVGENNYGIVEYCYNTGNIGDRNGFWDLDYVGGIVGNNSGTVRYCVNSGDLDSNGDGTGGIVGINGDDVYYCFNNGTVNGDEAAGITCTDNSGRTRDCYNAGKVDADNLIAIDSNCRDATAMQHNYRGYVNYSLKGACKENSRGKWFSEEDFEYFDLDALLNGEDPLETAKEIKAEAEAQLKLKEEERLKLEEERLRLEEEERLRLEEEQKLKEAGKLKADAPLIGGMPKEGEEPKEGETPQVGEEPKEGETPQIGEEPKEGEAPQDGEEPKEGEAPQDGEEPQEGETPQAAEEPKEGETPQDGEEPEDGEEPQAGETPQAGEEPEDGEEPQAGETPEDGETPEGGETPEDGGEPQGVVDDEEYDYDEGQAGSTFEEYGPAIIVVALILVIAAAFFAIRRKKSV